MASLYFTVEFRTNDDAEACAFKMAEVDSVSATLVSDKRPPSTVEITTERWVLRRKNLILDRGGNASGWASAQNIF